MIHTFRRPSVDGDRARALRAAFAALAMLAVSTAAVGQDAPPAPSTEIRAREQALADALVARDGSRLSQLLTDDYVLRGSPDIDRATWTRNAVTLCWGDHADIDRFRSIDFDNVAVASFELTFYVDPSTCGPAVLRSLITDVWTRDVGGGWRLRIRHAAPPPPEGAGIAAQYAGVPEPPPAWEVSSELSLIATRGNTSTRTIGVEGTMIHRADRTVTEASVAFLTSEAASVTTARSLTAEARQGLRVSDRIELFGRGTYARDRFAGIENRPGVDAGLAYIAPLPPAHLFAVESSAGFVVERRLNANQLSFATGTGALHYAWTPKPGTRVSEDFEVVADLATAANWRAGSETAVSVTLTRLLSLKASHVVDYRHRPVLGFRRTDMRTAVALVISLQRRPDPS
jgi:putative salt-induced outer membrane protein YdiY